MRLMLGIILWKIIFYFVISKSECFFLLFLLNWIQRWLYQLRYCRLHLALKMLIFYCKSHLKRRFKFLFINARCRTLVTQCKLLFIYEVHLTDVWIITPILLNPWVISYLILSWEFNISRFYVKNQQKFF